MKQNLSYKNPYPGIRSFNTNEGALFFGRDKQIRELTDILNHSHFAAISGASGSGKSSLIKAGLIPQITANKDEWEFISFRPGSSPEENFAAALHQMLNKSDYDRKTTGSARKTAKRIKTDYTDLLNLLNEIKFSKKLLIYIDQFEEIFRYMKDELSPDAEKNAANFVQMILHAIEKPNKPKVYIILSLRSDFLGECSQFKGLSEAINSGHYLIPRMSTEQKLESVTGPAEKAAAVISPELIQQIQYDITHKTDNLLVLQHAMMRTWNYWLLNADPSRPIDVKHYEAVGTVSNALSIHAEMIYNSLADETERTITERIFKALTELGEDKKGIRRPATLREVSAITGYPEPDILDVSEKFREEGNSFLMPDASSTVTSESVLDISHESIMRVWQRLATWVSEETKSAETYLRLSKSAELYQEGKAGLLVNPDLQLAIQWLDENRPNQAWADRYDPAFDRVKAYIQYSNKEYQKHLAAKEEKQKKRLKRTRLIAIFLGTASLISVFFLIISLSLKIKAEASENKARENEQMALIKSKYADEQKKQAVSNELISKQQQEIAEQHRLLAEEQKEIAIAQRAIANHEKNRAIAAMKQVSEEKKKVEELLETTRKLRDLALQNEKEALAEKKRAVNAEKRAVAARKLAASKTLAIQSLKLYAENQKNDQLSEQQKQLPYQLALYAYHFYKTNSESQYDTDIFNALLTTAENSKNISGSEGHTASVRQAVFAPDGNEFASISDDRSLKTFNISGEKILNFIFADHSNTQKFGFPICISYTPKQTQIAVGDNLGNILLINNDPLNPDPQIKKPHQDAVNDILFLTESDFISISDDGNLILHETGKKAQIILTDENGLSDLAADETGMRIAVASKSNTVRILNLSEPEKPKKIELPNTEIRTLAWGKDNELLVGTQSGKIIIIKDQTIMSEFFAHSSGVNSIVFDKESNHIYTCGYDKTIKIREYGNYDYETIISPDKSWVLSLDYCPKSKTLLAAYDDKTIGLININTHTLVEATKKKVNRELSPVLWKRFIGDDINQNNNSLKALFNIQ